MIVLVGVTALLTYRDLPDFDRGSRSLDLPNNPLWLMLALFLNGGRYDCGTHEKRSGVRGSQR